MYWLNDDMVFPNPAFASDEGLLAAGGDLSPQRLLFAYQEGVFPWYSEDEPILWWSPNPRFVLFPNKIYVSKSMRQVIRREIFEVSFDKAFHEVIAHCANTPRRGQNGTWLIPEMIEAYHELHQLGFAHSVEVWEEEKLVGGLYGISLGKCFFGESMFGHVSNASKTALIYLARTLEAKGFSLIDCQSHTKHLASMGAEFIDRNDFLGILEQNKQLKTHRGVWTDWTPARK